MRVAVIVRDEVPLAVPHRRLVHARRRCHPVEGPRGDVRGDRDRVRRRRLRRVRDEGDEIVRRGDRAHRHQRIERRVHPRVGRGERSHEIGRWLEAPTGERRERARDERGHLRILGSGVNGASSSVAPLSVVSMSAGTKRAGPGETTTKPMPSAVVGAIGWGSSKSRVRTRRTPPRSRRSHRPSRDHR